NGIAASVQLGIGHSHVDNVEFVGILVSEICGVDRVDEVGGEGFAVQAHELVAAVADGFLRVGQNVGLVVGIQHLSVGHDLAALAEAFFGHVRQPGAGAVPDAALVFAQGLVGEDGKAHAGGLHNAGLWGNAGGRIDEVGAHLGKIQGTN